MSSMSPMMLLILPDEAVIEESGGYVAEGDRLVTGTADLLKGMLAAASRNGELLHSITSQTAELDRVVDLFTIDEAVREAPVESARRRA